MESEVFVLKSKERAYEWVEIFAESTGEDEDQALNILACICGFDNSEEMLEAILLRKPSICDEKIGKKALKKRHREFIDRLTHECDFDDEFAQQVIEKLSPSTEKHFRYFEVGKPRVVVEREFEIELPNPKDMLRYLGVDGLAGISGLVRRLFGDDYPINLADIDHDDIRARSMICGPTEVLRWASLFQGLGWNLKEGRTSDLPGIGKPGVVIDDEVHGLVPVYFFGLVRAPNDTEARPSNIALEVAERDLINCWGKGNTAMVVWDLPQRKVVNGNSYCHVGMIHYDEGWKDVLLTRECKTFAQLYEANEWIEDISSDPGVLIDEESQMFHGISIFMSGKDDDGAPKSGWVKKTIETMDGWELLKIRHER